LFDFFCIFEASRVLLGLQIQDTDTDVISSSASSAPPKWPKKYRDWKISKKKGAKNIETENKIAHKNRVQKYRSNISRNFALATRPEGYSGDSTPTHTIQSIFQVSCVWRSGGFWGPDPNTIRFVLRGGVSWKLEPKTSNAI